MFQIVTTNTKAVVRNDSMEGRDWLVGPVAMITEGVHNGSGGPIYYPAEELAKLPLAWNHKPVVVYHPDNRSACDPIEITTRKVGVLMNTAFDSKTKKLRSEAWLDPSRMDIVDPRVSDAIENGEMMEVSTGLYMELDTTPGTWNGEEYIGIARNLQPDHLALLPDKKGACSIEDGAGFLRLNSEKMRQLVMNVMSHGSIRSMLAGEVREKRPDAWIEDVYDGFFIFEDAGKLYKQSYSKNENDVDIEGDAIEVVRVTEYRKVSDGGFVANKDEDDAPEGGTKTINNKSTVKKSFANLKGSKMDKTKMVDAIIANERTDFTEENRESLMELDEAILNAMVELGKEPEKKVDNTDGDDVTPVANEPKAKKVSVDEYVKNMDAPDEIKKVLRNAISTQKEIDNTYIEKILANKNNTFTRQHLEMKDTDELKALAKLAETAVEPVDNNTPPLYLGNGGNPVKLATNDEEPLTVPTMEFAKAG